MLRSCCVLYHPLRTTVARLQSPNRSFYVRLRFELIVPNTFVAVGTARNVRRHIFSGWLRYLYLSLYSLHTTNIRAYVNRQRHAIRKPNPILPQPHEILPQSKKETLYSTYTRVPVFVWLLSTWRRYPIKFFVFNVTDIEKINK